MLVGSVFMKYTLLINIQCLEFVACKFCVCVCGWIIFCYSVIMNPTVSSLHPISISLSLRFVLAFTAFPPSFPLRSQASRPLGVGFCDGNHGPRQSLCLQRSREGGRLYERSRGTHSSRAGYNRNCPQSFGGHICLHLHVRHLKPFARGT